jgi:hypothetical protein
MLAPEQSGPPGRGHVRTGLEERREWDTHPNVQQTYQGVREIEDVALLIDDAEPANVGVVALQGAAHTIGRTARAASETITELSPGNRHEDRERSNETFESRERSLLECASCLIALKSSSMTHRAL